MPLLEQYGAIYPNGDPLAQGSYQPVTNLAPKPVTVLSSANGQTALNQNTTSLSNTEKAITGQASTPTSPYTFQLLPTGKVDIMENGKSLSQGGPGFDASYAQQLGYSPGPIMGGASPATQKMATDINNAVGQGGLTAQEKAGLDGLTTTQEGLLAAAAAARTSLESKDYPSMDFHTRRAEELQRTLADQLSSYYKETKPLRDRAMAALTPGEQEKQLGKKLLDIRGQADQFKEQTEMDKLREYEGQTLGFAGGRASEIDLKAQSRLRTMVAEEKNILLELGLEQEARKMEGQSVEQALNYLHDDFELQSKIQERFTQIEDDLFDRADALRSDAKDALGTILDKLEGVNPDNLPAALLSQIEEIAARANLPFDIVKEALKVQYQKKVFDESIRRSQEQRLSASADGKPAGTLEERNRAGASSMATQLNTVADENGFITEKQYAIAKRAWITQGLASADFDKQFATYKNPDLKYMVDVK